jgi:hypothetical protein
MRRYPVSIGLILLAIAAAFAAVIYIRRHYPQNAVVEFPAFSHSFPKNQPTPDAATQKTLASHVLLAVPFTAQAPNGVWDEIHKEACEEASLFKAAEYYRGNTTTKLSAQTVTNEIIRMQDWEEKTFGYHIDINLAETARMAEEVYGLQTKIITNFNEQDIKQALSENKLILFPADGRLLKNPYFRSPGPPYHMLVIRGYNSGGFLTNDPGTKNGQNYLYSFQVLTAANGDWSHETNSVDLSKKNILVVWK